MIHIQWTLSRKLVVAVLMMVAVPFLVVQGLYYRDRYERDQLQALDQDREIAQAAANAIEARVADVSRTQHAAGLALLDLQLEPEEANRYLSRVSAIDDALSITSLVGPDGVVWASSDTAALGVSVEDRAYYERARTGTGWTVSGLLESRVQGGAVVIVATTLRGGEGTPSWVIASSMRPAALERIASLELAGGRQVLLIDQAGMLIDSRASDTLSPTQRNYADIPAVAAALAGGEYLLPEYVSPRSGVRRIGAVVAVPTIGWVVAVTEPVDQALGPARQAAMLSLVMLGLLAVLSTGMAWTLAHPLIRPLASLNRAARSLGAGDLSVRAPVTTADEVGDLASTFNAMADRIEDLYGRLHTELGMRGDEVQSLHAAIQAVASTLRPAEVQERLVRVACELLQAQAAWLSLYNPEAQRLEMGAYFGAGQQHKSKLVFNPGHGAIGEVFTTRKPLFVPDLALYKDTQYARQALAVGIQSVLCAPLVTKGQVLGVLGVAASWMSAANPPRPQHVDALVALAAHAAVAIENARLYEGMAETNRELVAINRRLEAVVEAMPAGVLIVDYPSGAITAGNRAAVDLIGHELPAGAPFFVPSTNRILRPDGRAYALGDLPLARSMRHGVVCRGEEMVLERPDGRWVTLLATSAPLYDADGGVAGAVSVFQDIDRLKEADRLKDEFVSLVSHELRTPLTTIKAYATSLLQKQVHWRRDERDRFLRVMVQECDRLTRMVQSLLDLSAIEAGSLRIERSWCDLRELLEVAVDRLNGVLSGREVVLDVPPNVPLVAADYTRLEQVVSNLLENAAKYSAPGTVIAISCCASDREVKVTVRDEGVGVPEKDRERIFDKFYRGEKRASAGNQGVGLGLAICRGLVTAHGGRIYLADGTGSGSAFTFTIPLDADPAGTSAGT